MGGIIGKVTDAVGLTDNKGEAKAARSAAEANQQAYALSKEQIEFQKEQYADWKNVYGDLQKNLGDYYKNLSGEKITAMGLQNQQMEYQNAVQAIEQDAAQRNVSGSGLEFAAKSNATFQNAEARATIRSQSEQKAAEQKLGFLGVGLGQGTQMLGVIGNAYGTAVQSRTNVAGQYIGQQTQLSTNNTNAMGSVVGSVAGSYLP